MKVASTRNQKDEADFKHIITEVLDQDEITSPLVMALKDIACDCVDGVIAIPNQSIDSLGYSDGNGGRVTLKSGPKDTLRNFRSLVNHRSNQGNPITD